VTGERRFLRASPVSRHTLAIAAALFITVTFRFAQHTGSWIIGILVAVVFFAIGGIFLAPTIAFLAFGSFAVFYAAVDILVIEPVAWVLERDEFDRWVKMMSLVLLLIGFHFDMLVS